MSKPTQQTRQADAFKRQLGLLEGYLHGSIYRLEAQAKEHPAEKEACDMAKGELLYILNKVLPAMKEVKP